MERNMSSITVVSTPDLKETGAIDPTYLYFAPEAAENKPYGLLIKLPYMNAPSSSNQAIQQPLSGFAWRLSLFTLANGLVLTVDIPDLPNQEALANGLRGVVQQSEFSILMKADEVPDFQYAATMAGAAHVVHPVNAPVSTSGNSRR
jgi:hypothetical protein